MDKSWKGTTEQFTLHFNEQLRQLDEVSPPEESLPYTTRLTLLQTAVHNIPELRMVETMEEFISLSSSTPGPTMGYDNYLTLLQNACIRYDSNLKSRPSPASRAAYQHELSHDQHGMYVLCTCTIFFLVMCRDPSSYVCCQYDLLPTQHS